MTDWTTPRTSPISRDRAVGMSRALERESPLRRSDWVLTVAVVILCAYGAVLVWAATRSELLAHHLDGQAHFKKQILYIAVGIALGVVVSLVDNRILRAYVPVVYLASVIGLVAVLSPLGSTINGAKSWIDLPGGFTLQPAEFAKVAIVVGLAMFLGERRDSDDGPRRNDVLLSLALAAVPIGLIMLEPDFGTCAIIVLTIFAVLSVSGVRARWLLGLVLAAGLVTGIAVQQGYVKSYQFDRLTSFTHPTENTQGAGWQTNQARIAIGSGGLTGKGLFNGTQTNGGFVPEQDTDFVFSVAGEEFGLVGTGGLIALLGVVLWRGMRIARRASDTFGALVAAGVVSWFAFQAFENIGMNLGIMPMTGVPLPFISSGGSAAFANLIAVGLLQNVHLRAQEG